MALFDWIIAGIILLVLVYISLYKKQIKFLIPFINQLPVLCCLFTTLFSLFSPHKL
jgi:hypothetical protein